MKRVLLVFSASLGVAASAKAMDIPNAARDAIRGHFKNEANLEMTLLDRIHHVVFAKVSAADGIYLVTVLESPVRVQAVLAASKDCDGCTIRSIEPLKKNITADLHLVQVTINEDEDSVAYDGFVWNSKNAEIVDVYNAAGVDAQFQGAEGRQMKILFSHGPDIGAMGNGDSLSLPTKNAACQHLEEKLNRIEQGHVGEMTVTYQWGEDGKPGIARCEEVAPSLFQPVSYQTAACSCHGTFDTQGLTLEEINNSIDLISGKWESRDTSFEPLLFCGVNDQPEYDNVSLAASERVARLQPVKESSEKVYQELVSSLAELKVASSLNPYRQELLHGIQFRKTLADARMNYAMTGNPPSLDDAVLAKSLPEECDAFARLVNMPKENDVIEKWKPMNYAACAKRDPQHLDACEANLKISQDRMLKDHSTHCHAVMFDWTNCVNDSWRENNLKRRDTVLKQALQNVHCQCNDGTKGE